MVKKVLSLAIVTLFLFASLGICADTPLNQPTAQGTEKTKDRISRGVNNLFYGPMETAQNLNETKTKGTPVYKCNARTRTGVERGIARVVTGVWQLATFWYSDPGCVTSTKAGAQAAAAVTTAPTTAPAATETAPMAGEEVK